MTEKLPQRNLTPLETILQSVELEVQKQESAAQRRKQRLDMAMQSLSEAELLRILGEASEAEKQSE